MPHGSHPTPARGWGPRAGHIYPLVRHVAAIELAKRWPADLPEQSIRELFETLTREEYKEPSPIEEEYASVTSTEDGGGCLGQDIVRRTFAVPWVRAGENTCVPHLLEFWSFDPQFYELGEALLALAFPAAPAGANREHLTGVQRRVLEAFLRNQEIWFSDLNWPRLLAARGLPGRLDEMQLFLGYRD